MAAYGHINPYLGWAYPSEKYDFVSWGYSSQLNGTIKFMFQTTNQLWNGLTWLMTSHSTIQRLPMATKIWRVSYHESNQRGFRETALWNAYDFWDPSHWGNPWSVASCCRNWSHFCPRLAATLAARQPGKWDQTLYPQGRSVTKLWLINYYVLLLTIIITFSIPWSAKQSTISICGSWAVGVGKRNWSRQCQTASSAAGGQL